MTRKRVKHELISSERKKNVVFSKRVESLTKQANHLSILCGVDIGMVVHKPTENNVILWPSPEIFGERLRKFMDITEFERARKMVLHEQYADDRLNDETKDMKKSCSKKDLKESKLLMHELLQDKSFDEVDLEQLNRVQSFIAEILKKLHIRDEELNNEQESQRLALPPPASRSR